MDSELPICPPARRAGRLCLLLFVLIVTPFFPAQVKESSSIPTPVVSNVPVLYRLDSIPSSVPKNPPPIKIPPEETRYHPIILAASSKHQVDPALVKAIIKAESGYNPVAVSEKGAVGLMQLMPATADDLGIKDLFDPELNIQGGVKYLKQLLNLFEGNLVLAIAAYNAGIGNVRKYEGIPPYRATRYYVKKVLEYYRCYKDARIGKSNRV